MSTSNSPRRIEGTVSRTSDLRFTTILFAILSMTVPLDSSAQEAAHPAEASPTSHAQYCGIYSLYTLMELAGVDIEFSELIRPEYVDSRVGSRLGQLKHAAEDFGLHAAAVGNMTVRTLQESPYPLVLHVKKSVKSNQYNHFELYLGSKNGQAILYDPPNSPRLEPFPLLVSRWDRTGLAVSKDEIDTQLLFLPAYKQSFLIGFLVTAVILIIWWLVPRTLKALCQNAPTLRRRIKTSTP